jgi:outer membrane immunogenic protein
MKNTFFALGAALLSLPAAHAADLSYKDAPMESVPACAAAQFGGFSVGGYIGGAQSTSSVSDIDDWNTGATYEHETSGFAGGVQVAYDFARCHTLIGIVADATFLNADKSGLYDDDDEYKTSMEWMSTVRLRAGVALDNLYLYATGGIAFADLNNRMRDITELDEDETYPSWKSDSSRVGWTVGAGFEYALSSRLMFMTEVLYADFGNDDSTGYYRAFDDGGALEDEEAYRARFSDEVVVAKVGLTYRFGPRDHMQPMK